MSEVKELIKLLVEIGNEYKDVIMGAFDEDISKYSLALLISDIEEKYGFFVSEGRFKYVEGKEAEAVVPKCTVIAILDSDFLVKMINSDDWEKMCKLGYNLGKIDFIATDKRYFKHGKNLLKVVKMLNEIVSGE